MPKHARLGNLLIDHRAFDGTQLEADTSTCSHCQRVVVLNSDRSRPRGYCRKCDHYVCDQCDGGECSPFARILENFNG